MEAVQALMERELGHTLLKILGEQTLAELIVPAAERRAFGIVQDIQAVLDDESLSDFYCVEEIVCILEKAGVPTSRHDFG